MRVYIAGPMTGLHDYNYPAFNEAAARWRAAKLIRVPESMVAGSFSFVSQDTKGLSLLGAILEEITVLNPAENFGGDQSLDYKVYLRQAFKDVASADAIAVLPGWEKSNGAKREVMIGQTIGLKFYNAITFQRIDLPRMTVVPQSYVDAVESAIT